MENDLFDDSSSDVDETAALHEQLAEAAEREAAIRRSKFWRLRDAWLRVKQSLRLAGPDPLAPGAAGDVLDSAHRGVSYKLWLSRNDVRDADLERMRATVPLLSFQPRISIVVPVCDPDPAHFDALIASIEAQVYPEWELCIADDASTTAAVRDRLDRLEADPRVRIVRRPVRGGISAASNDALAVASGEFVVMVDHDDVLAPHALFEIAFALQAQPDLDVLYSDEDKIDETGRRFDPYFKPEWSPETLLSKMFAGHLLCYRRSVLVDAGGFRSAFDGSQDYDALLRISERTSRIAHLQAVLYHWRVHRRSTASSVAAKPYTVDAAVRAVREALERRGAPARVAPATNGTSFVHVEPLVRGTPRVAVIIPTRDKAELLDRALAAVLRVSTYQNVEVIVVDNGSVEPETAALLDRWRALEPERLRVRRDDRPFNYSRINNEAAASTDAPYLLLLNNDVEACEANWLTALLGWLQLDGVGATGGMLVYPNGTVQHAGVIIGINGLAEHAYRAEPAHRLGYFGSLQTATNYSAVTGACLMTRHDVFDAAGGLDETLPVAWNDIDYCLRIRDAGHRIVYVPDAKMVHHESATRGFPATGAAWAAHAAEVERMRERWKVAGTSDPYYHPALTLKAPNFGLRL
jgi:GT2 family glycosyltransferase